MIQIYDISEFIDTHWYKSVYKDIIYYFKYDHDETSSYNDYNRIHVSRYIEFSIDTAEYRNRNYSNYFLLEDCNLKHFHYLEENDVAALEKVMRDDDNYESIIYSHDMNNMIYNMETMLKTKGLLNEEL